MIILKTIAAAVFSFTILCILKDVVDRINNRRPPLITRKKPIHITSLKVKK